MPRNVTVSEREHFLMGRIADACRQASSDCLEMSTLRPDQRDLWMKAGALFKTLEGQVFDLATGGLLTREVADKMQ